MFKENLMSALKRAVDLHNSGSGDNESVIKSASEHDFNPDQTQRLVETYNTAKTICFYKTADDRSQKFTLADGGAVAKNLFKDRLPEYKSADTLKIHDYSVYDDAVQMDEIGTSWVLDEVKAAAVHERNLELAKADPAGRRDIFGIKVGEPMNDHQLASKYKEVDDIKMAAAKAADAALMVDSAYGMAINDIARDIGMDKIAEAYSALQAQPRCDMSAQVLEDIVARFPGFDKNAAPDFTMFDAQHPEIMAVYAEACDYFIKYATFKAAQAELECAAEKMAASLYSPAHEDSGTEFFTSSVKDMLVRGDVKYAEGKSPTMFADPMGVVGGGVATGVQSSTKDLVTGTLGSLMDTKNKESKVLTDKAKNLHRKFILEKMITTDPILKGVPEEDVIKAYQAIVQLAPEVSLNEEVTRSILRQATNASSISPFDAKSYVDLDTSIRSQLEQQGGAKKDVKKPQGV